MNPSLFFFCVAVVERLPDLRVGVQFSCLSLAHYVALMGGTSAWRPRWQPVSGMETPVSRLDRNPRMLVTTFWGELDAPKSELPSFENRADDSPAPFPSDDDATVPALSRARPYLSQEYIHGCLGSRNHLAHSLFK